MTATLLGEWGFLDNLQDSSGNSRHATANYTPTYTDGPQPNTRAIRFADPLSRISYGRTGLEPTSGGIVSMAWVKLLGAQVNYMSLITKMRAFDSTRHGISLASQRLFLMSRWRDQLDLADDYGPNLGDGVWHHVANVDADDRSAWFIDGVLQHEAARSGSAPVFWEDFPWVTGSNPDATQNPADTDVVVSGVRLFQGTMTNAEVVTWKNTPIVSAPVGRSGRPKVWNGSAWVPRQTKRWDGSNWISVPVSGYDGSGWVASK